MSIFDSSGLASTPSSITATRPSADIKPYSENVLAKGNALLNAGVPAYTGQMTAGPSEYQDQAWKGLANLTLPKNMTEAGTTLGDLSSKQANYKFDPASVDQYMNPYLQKTLDPQLAELRRQSEINLQPQMAKLIMAGGYGGGRQAVLQGAENRNLSDLQSKVTGQVYKDAYDSAMKSAQYASDLGLKGLQQATTAAQGQGNVGAQEASYGLQNLNALSTAGKTQQEQDQAALNAQYNEFLRQQKYLPEALKDQSNLIRNAPGGTETATYKAKPSTFQSILGTGAGVADFVKNMKAAGITMDSIGNALRSMGIDLSKFKTDAEGNVTGEYTEDPFGGFPGGGSTGDNVDPNIEPGLFDPSVNTDPSLIDPNEIGSDTGEFVRDMEYREGRDY
jgi:hypothetical protein